MSIAPGALRRASAALFAVASMTLVACAGPGVQSIPESSQGRLSLLAERLPASSEASVYVTDLKGLSAGIKRVDASFGDAAGGVRDLQAELNDKFGIDLMDTGSLRDAAGIAPDGGLAFGFVDNRSVLLIYVVDAEKFDAFVGGKIRDEIGLEGEVATEKVGDVEVRVLGANVEKQLAWAHFGKVAILATPQLDPEKGGEASISKFVAGIYGNDKGASTSSSASFKQFVSEFGGKYLVAAFANPGAIKKSKFYPELKEEFSREEGADDALKNFEEYCTSLGMGFDLRGDVIKSHFFYGGNAEFGAYYAGLSDVADATFNGFATSSLIAMGRVSLNLAAALSLTEKFAKPEAWNELQSGIGEASEAVGFDLQTEVIDQLTGNMGGYFYGVDLGQAMGGGGIAAAQFATVAQFKNAEAPLKILNKVLDLYNAEQAKNTPPVDPMNPDMAPPAITPVTLTPMAGGQGYTLPGAGSIIATGDLIVFASGSMLPAQLELLVQGKGGELLSSPLGKPFAQGKAHGGLYINIEQLGLLVSPLVAGSPEASMFFSTFRDAALYFDSSKRGISSTIEFEMLPLE